MSDSGKNIKLQLTKSQKQIRLRLLEILYKADSSHIGSCLSVIDLIDSVYAVKKKNEKFILSSGHTGAALYVVLEKYGFLKNPDIKRLGVHPDRNPKIGIDASTGSLGQGLPIAVGMAISDRSKNVYCLISDGECAEGSMWESFRIIQDFKITNLKIVLSVNGWGAYDPISPKILKKRLKGFDFLIHDVDGHDMTDIKENVRAMNTKPTILFAQTNSEQLPFLQGVDAHYHKMTDIEYKEARTYLL